jgi:hypothetical protein
MTIGGAGLKRRVAVVACVGFLLISSAGCAAERTPVQPSATPTAEPVFASDEEALAAATEAYANYQKMADQIDSESGGAPERIAPFVSERFLPLAVQQFDGFRETQARSIGSTTFVVETAQHMDYKDPAQTSVSLYICDDVSAVDVVDETGRSLVSEARVPITPFEVTFVLSTNGELVVDARDVWEGENFC